MAGGKASIASSSPLATAAAERASRSRPLWRTADHRFGSARATRSAAHRRSGGRISRWTTAARSSPVSSVTWSSAGMMWPVLGSNSISRPPSNHSDGACQYTYGPAAKKVSANRSSSDSGTQPDSAIDRTSRPVASLQRRSVTRAKWLSPRPGVQSHGTGGTGRTARTCLPGCCPRPAGEPTDDRSPPPSLPTTARRADQAVSIPVQPQIRHYPAILAPANAATVDVGWLSPREAAPIHAHDPECHEVTDNG